MNHFNNLFQLLVESIFSGVHFNWITANSKLLHWQRKCTFVPYRYSHNPKANGFTANGALSINFQWNKTIFNNGFHFVYNKVSFLSLHKIPNFFQVNASHKRFAAYVKFSLSSLCQFAEPFPFILLFARILCVSAYTFLFYTIFFACSFVFDSTQTAVAATTTKQLFFVRYHLNWSIFLLTGSINIKGQLISCSKNINFNFY